MRNLITSSVADALGGAVPNHMKFCGCKMCRSGMRSRMAAHVRRVVRPRPAGGPPVPPAGQGRAAAGARAAGEHRRGADRLTPNQELYPLTIAVNRDVASDRGHSATFGAIVSTPPSQPHGRFGEHCSQ